MTLSEFIESSQFQTELKKLSSSMKQVVKRGASDITYRSAYNKRPEVAASRAVYMKGRNRQNSAEAKLGRLLLQNPGKTVAQLKKEGLIK